MRILFDGDVTLNYGADPHEPPPQPTVYPLAGAPLHPELVRFELPTVLGSMPGGGTCWGTANVIAVVAPDPSGSGAWGAAFVPSGGPPDRNLTTFHVVVCEPEVP